MDDISSLLTAASRRSNTLYMKGLASRHDVRRKYCGNNDQVDYFELLNRGHIVSCWKVLPVDKGHSRCYCSRELTWPHPQGSSATMARLRAASAGWSVHLMALTSADHVNLCG
ncbi:hypothetical protein RRG08_063358 [Elysia crispata]|uniref:Uncharacterized protein n=1 Tax=Elysia crispata TaxID=231223 RepID=A0AAE1E8L0_9GAST|nr:hypothetical protein RRG08_063358 [Elysia crispata]